MAEPQMRDISIVARLDSSGLRVTLQGRAVYGDGEQERVAAHAIDLSGPELEVIRNDLLHLVRAHAVEVTDATIKGAMEAREVAIRRKEMHAAGADAREQTAHILDLMGGMTSKGSGDARPESGEKEA